ncbi:UNVERIFIED_CONTAM: hypothetical protein K2H54_019456 [Gekko kuhli]
MPTVTPSGRGEGGWAWVTQHLGRKTERDQGADRDLSLPGKPQTASLQKKDAASAAALVDFILPCCSRLKISSWEGGGELLPPILQRGGGWGELPFSTRTVDAAAGFAPPLKWAL